MKANILLEPISFSEKKKLRIPRLSASPSLVIFISACTVSAFYNLTLWRLLLDRIEPLSVPGLCFIVIAFLLSVLIITLLLAPLSSRHTLKPGIIFLLFTSGIIQYFNNIGVVIDDSMIKNIVDSNSAEAFELVNASLLAHLVVYSVLPSFFILKIDVSGGSCKVESTKIVALVFFLMSLIAALLYSNFQYATFFWRENRDVRLYMNPAYPIYSTASYLSETYGVKEVFKPIGEDAVQVKSTIKPIIGIFVVGETARADRFSINGYEKPTTPYLENRQLINFSNASSCGTSTAYSVPCMFSFLNEDRYTPTKASSQSNVLDILSNVGVSILWRDNNSSCKGVCARIDSENLRSDYDENSPFYNHGEYLDEALLENLDSFVAKKDGDVLIVLHPLGSHGPAYHKRYPESFAQFSPSCQSNSPHNCSPEVVSNSYDNTILYTDYFLEKTIRFLESQTEKYNTFLMYVSDHGESLGENGVYLHGLPKSIAPVSQTHIPFMLWLSEDFRDQRASTYHEECMKKEISHDYITHSLLGLFEVRTALRDESKNVLNMNCVNVSQ